MKSDMKIALSISDDDYEYNIVCNNVRDAEDIMNVKTDIDTALNTLIKILEKRE